MLIYVFVYFLLYNVHRCYEGTCQVLCRIWNSVNMSIMEK
jgi:hypothetical protein